VQKDGWSAGAGEGGREFVADVARFADAGDHHFAPVFKNHVDRSGQIIIQTGRYLEDGLGLRFQHRPGHLNPLFGLFLIAHNPCRNQEIFS